MIITELTDQEKRQYITWRKKTSCIITYLRGDPVICNCRIDGEVKLQALSTEQRQMMRIAWPLRVRIKQRMHGIKTILEGKPMIANWFIG
jgi:hypothetical protein